jgi:hypothetical protein
MSVQVKRRRDTSTNVAAYTGAQGELIVDVTNNRVTVHDGTTAGGFPAAKLSEAVLNTAASNVLAQGPNGSKITHVVAEQLVSGLSGASVTASVQIPAGALVKAVASRVVTAITGPTSFEIGYSGSLNTFGSGLGLTAGSTNEGLISPNPFYTATSIVLTATGGSFSAGAVRLSVVYEIVSAPTS